MFFYHSGCDSDPPHLFASTSLINKGLVDKCKIRRNVLIQWNYLGRTKTENKKRFIKYNQKYISILFFTKNIEKIGEICHNIYRTGKNVARENKDDKSKYF